MKTGIMDLKVGPRLEARVDLTKPAGVLKQRVELSWRGKNWILEFRARPQKTHTVTTHGWLQEKKQGPRKVISASAELLKREKERLQEATGWRFERFPEGVRAAFDPKKLRDGTLASFSGEFNGQVYLCQFRLKEKKAVSRKDAKAQRKASSS